jgi:murein DD-endopeptidase MepM/ murein hydrolase activator NlpD
MRRHGWWIGFGCAALVLLLVMVLKPDFRINDLVDEPVVPVEAVQLAPDSVVVPIKIRRGSNLGSLLRERGVDSGPVRQAALSHYDLAKIRPDRDLQLVYADGDEKPVAVRYNVDEDKTVVVTRSGDKWIGSLETVDWEANIESLSFALTRSLWQDGLDEGLRPGDLVRLAQIFEYELDFNSELRKGASFALVGEILRSPGRKPKMGVIHAARVSNNGRDYVAVGYQRSSGEEGFYHPDGTGMKRPFLRSPIEFSRVTSGFNPRRFHPIKKTHRAHNGTDFGAPTGTPVRAVGNGVVVYAGRSGGHGNFVKIDHPGTWHTSYSHLSKIGVKKGQTVKQGQYIGKVGSTGLSTGPHLHYQMWHHGKYVDAMRVALPKSEPLPKSELGPFRDVAEKWVSQLPNQ